MPFIKKAHHHHHVQKSLPIQSYGQVSQGYGGMPLISQFDQQQQQVPQAPVLTPAGKISIFFIRKFYLNIFFRSSLSWSKSRNCHSIGKWSFICCLS
jgi:hypothetical protein